MRLSTPERDRGRSEGTKTANELLKAEARDRLHWSIVASVLTHVVVILAWPELQASAIEFGGSDAPALEQIVLGQISAPGGAPAPILPALEPVDRSASEGSESEAGEGDDLGGATSRWDGRGDALQRLASVRPRVVEVDLEPDTVPEPQSRASPETSENDASDGLRIREGTSDMEYERLSEEELLNLQRLSALRPELALTSLSGWLVIQNPKEVGAFLRTRFPDQRAEGTPRRSLGVAVWVDERGSVEWAEINRSSGRPELDESALELFQDVVAFRPARVQGLRVPVAVVYWLLW